MCMCVCEVFANGDCAAVKGCTDSSRAEAEEVVWVKAAVVWFCVYFGKPAVATLPACYLKIFEHNQQYVVMTAAQGLC